MRDPHFRHLLVLTLMAAGCSGNKEPVVPETPAPEPAPVGTEMQPGTGSCEEGLVYASAMRPATAGAPLELRRVQTRFDDAERSVEGQDGAICEEDPACTTAAEALWEAEPIRSDCGQIGCTNFVLITAAGGTPSALTGDSLLDYLGPIDTAAEARLLAWSKGFDVACSPSLEGQVYVVQATQFMSDCPMQTDTVSIEIDAGGALKETQRSKGEPGPCAGRLPPGVQVSGQAHSAGAWLAHAAEMEASSAHAFQVLAGELAAHGAPENLVAWALRAEQEELSHARTMGALAQQQGCSPAPIPLPQLPQRSLLAIALDNAEEGLGRELWGVLSALWQSQHAQDPQLRVAMRQIALEECRHAEFSRALHAWLQTQLSAGECAQICARAEAVWAKGPGQDSLTSSAKDWLGLPPPELFERAREVLVG